MTKFDYDGAGRRSRIIEYDSSGMSASTNQYIWCGLSICEQRSGDNGGTVEKRYFSGGVEKVQSPNAGNYYYTRDHLGSIRELVQSDGTTVAARYDYDPYGRRTIVSGTDLVDFGYTGHYYHAASGLHLAPFRAYDANLGRWLSRDLIGESGGLNLYGYVGNDPVNWADPLGLFTELLTFAPVGHGKSSFGHTALNINGTIYSFGEQGWHKESTKDYMARNSFRDAFGQELDLTPEQEKALVKEIEKDMKRNRKWTAEHNCTTTAREMLNNATDGDLTAPPATPFPADLSKFLEKKGAVIQTRPYPKSPTKTKATTDRK